MVRNMRTTSGRMIRPPDILGLPSNRLILREGPTLTTPTIVNAMAKNIREAGTAKGKAIANPTKELNRFAVNI
jgi:uncharacterized protein (DUF362 family)